MILTKLASHHNDDFVYINLEHVVSIYTHPDTDYHIEMTDGSSFHVKLTDSVITDLITAADA